MKRNIANVITVLRIVFTILLLFCSPLSVEFYVLYIAAGLSDIFDGIAARKTKTESEFGARFDTAADFMFFAVCLVKLIPILAFKVWMYILIIIVAIIKAISIVSGYVMFKRFVAVHTVMNKVTGILLFALPFAVRFVELKYYVIPVFAAAMIAAVQELLSTVLNKKGVFNMSNKNTMRICQCCGMPLDAEIIARNADGTPNENYCKWCYADGKFTYSDMETLIDVCVKHMVSEEFSEEQARAYMKQLLPTLDYWKRYEELSDNGEFEQFKQQLIAEINALGIDGMPKVESLNALVGSFVNLEYSLPNGTKAKFLDDGTTYLGTQLESEFGGERCFGVLACMDFILICTYEAEGKNPELVLYKKR